MSEKGFIVQKSLASSVRGQTLRKPGPSGTGRLRPGLLASWPGRLLVLLIAAALVGGAVIAQRSTAAPVTAAVRTAKVTVGAVTQSLLVSGSVNPVAQAKLNFETAGKLSAVYVKVGDVVIAGQALAKLDTTDLEAALAQTKINLISVQASYDRATAGIAPDDLAIAEQSLNKVKSTYASQKAVFASSAGGARADLVTLQNAFDSLQAALVKIQTRLQPVAQPTPTAVPTITPAPAVVVPTPAPTPNTALTDSRSAWNAVNQAQVSVANAQSYGIDQLRAAISDYLAATTTLNGAIAAFDAAIDANADTSSSATFFETALATYTTASSRLGSAIDTMSGLFGSVLSSLNSAQNALNTGGSRFDPSLDAARADVAAALAAANSGQSIAGSASATLSQADKALGPVGDAIEGSYVSAVQSFAKTTATPKPYDTASAYASLLSQQKAVDIATRNLANATLTAPTAGVVASIASQVGESVSSGGTTGFIVLATTGAMVLHGTIGEGDVGKLSLGQVASVTVDAAGPNARMTGKVTSVDPVATLQQGVPVYGVDITVDKPDQAVRAGMTGSASVVLASRQNVLTVPNLAIRSSGGRRFVQVLKDGQPVDADVQFGIANDTATEVTSGLSEGDLVVLPQPRATASTQPGGGGPGFGGAVVPGGFGR